MTLIAAAIVALLLAGVVLLLLGFRGRLVSTHPHCRACGFDLAGLPEPIAARPCPECGADLTARRAIRPGRRCRRPRVLVAGVLCLLLAAGAIGALAWGAATGFNWNTVKPFWWLEREAAATSSPQHAKSARVELARRATAGDLSPEHLERTLALAFDAQLGSPNAWVPDLGDMFESLHAKRRIDEATYGRFAASAVDLRAIIRERTPADRPLLFMMQARGTSIGTMSQIALWLDVTSETIDGHPTPEYDFHLPDAGFIVSELGQSTSRSKPLTPIAVGTHEVVWNVRVFVLPPGTELHTMYDADPNEHAIFVQDRTLRAAFEILPAGEETVTFAPADPDTDAAMHAAIQPIELTRRGRMLQYQLVFRGAHPVDAAFEVEITVAGHRAERAGSVVIPAAQWGGGYSSMIPDAIPAGADDPLTADVVLRSSLAAAYRMCPSSTRSGPARSGSRTCRSSRTGPDPAALPQGWGRGGSPRAGVKTTTPDSEEPGVGSGQARMPWQ